MIELPDGSGFFVGEIGPREPGFVSWLKYRANGSSRRWLYLWRNYVTARQLSRLPNQGPPMSRFKALRWALSVS